MPSPPPLQLDCLTHISGNQDGVPNCGSWIARMRIMYVCRPSPILSQVAHPSAPPTLEIELLQTVVGLERPHKCMQPILSNITSDSELLQRVVELEHVRQ